MECVALKVSPYLPAAEARTPPPSLPPCHPPKLCRAFPVMLSISNGFGKKTDWPERFLAGV